VTASAFLSRHALLVMWTF